MYKALFEGEMREGTAFYLVNYVTVERHRVTLAGSTHSHASDAK
jgi:hypothetical protein